ncbi:MAG: quinoprotein dehydrogenase-associated putative ABC transporter substrate-binding protein [Rhizobacter sp.]
MSSHSLERAGLRLIIGLLLAVGLVGAAAAAPEALPAQASPAASLPATLRVCADPDNLPYSRADESGFENRIARLIAEDLHIGLTYDWQPQIRGVVRKTINADRCDVLIGVPVGFDPVLTTRPYYRSAYVFVNRADAAARLESFDDPRLPTLAIGVQLIGDDLAATPPGHALARHGAVARVVGYPVYGEGPAAARATADLASGKLDAAVLWGPQAGYFAMRSAVPLRLVEARPPPDVALPFEFAIAMGVRKGNQALRAALDGVIERRGAEIAAILDGYGVPRRPLQQVQAAAVSPPHVEAGARP